MPTSQALRLCPGLIVVPHSHGVYGEYSQRVMALLREYGDDLQQISVDEAFMDMTGFRDGCAVRLRSKYKRASRPR